MKVYNVSLFNHCSNCKEKNSGQNFKRKKKDQHGKIENQSWGVESMVRSLTTLPRSTGCPVEVDFNS